MPVRALTGTRIRERRLALGLRQSALARQVGISASYLNLIEHNRRKIAGKLLTGIARALAVDVTSLSEGAGTALVEELREAAVRLPAAGAEEDGAEELAGRFPGWAALIGAQARRIARLERTIENLTDRLQHDPHLAASLHELLSTVTSINASASILVEPGELEPEWQARFHRNIHEDGTRLAEATRALVRQLEAESVRPQTTATPQEELEAWLTARDHHFPELEGPSPADVDAIIGAAPGLDSAAARELARRWLTRYRSDAERLPLGAFLQAVAEAGIDPGSIAQRFGSDLATTLRRLAVLPTPEGAGQIGLALSDGSGTLTFRKPADDFPLPRFGAGCPLWPLYQALARPMIPIRAALRRAGRDPRRFWAFAVAEPKTMGFDAAPVFEATMLIVPADRLAVPDAPLTEVGGGCRICPRVQCPARREPSILSA